MSRKNQLPLRAKKFLYPQLFWVELPHNSTLNNVMRMKFNQCLESVVAIYNEMKVLQIRRKWRYDDLSLVASNSFSVIGCQVYWSGVDKAIQFWENGRKKPANHVGSGHKFVKKMRMDHATREQCTKIGSVTTNWNCYVPDNKKQRRLPRSPPED